MDDSEEFDRRREIERQEWRAATPAVALARQVASEGWPVFPCYIDKGEKKPCWRGWQEDATTDPEAAAHSITQGRQMVGVVTRQRSGLVVLDIDVKQGPCAWHETNAARLEGTRRHLTRSGGYHYLFRPPPGIEIRGSVGKHGIAPGVDVRGKGNFVVWAGNPGYTVDRDLPIRDLADYPWLLELMVAKSARWTPPRSAGLSRRDPAMYGPETEYLMPGRAEIEWATETALRRIAEALERVGEAWPGERNDVLYRQALVCGGYMVAAGLTDEAWLVEQLADALAGQGLDRRKDLKTARDGVRWGLDHPLDPLDDDPCVVELYRMAHRLIDQDELTAADYRAALHQENQEMPEPLEAAEVDRIAQRCAARRGWTGRSH